VIEGRKTFGNTIKYIKMTASSNFGNMFSVLAASAFLPFLPMLPIQILVLNLLYDISQIAIPWDNMDMEYLKKPRQWDASGISRFMLWIGPTSSVFDITTYLLMWFVFGCNTASNSHLVALFNAGWFVESLMSQTLIVHLIRTKKIPFIQSRASKPVMLLTTAIIAVGVAIPFTQVGKYLRMATLPLSYFPWLILTMVCYMTLCQALKMFYIKRYKTFL
jgi:Cation transport ATPase